MKNLGLTLAMMLFMTTIALGQQTMASIGGGYVFTNVEYTDTDATGWRINGTYEFKPISGKVSHGVSIGYINVKAEDDLSENVIGTIPIYYIPRLYFGQNSLQFFLKGALGAQFSTLDRTGPALEVESSDFGFYGGLGAGVIKTFNEKIFLNLEYEWAYTSNSYYRDGFINSIMLSIGSKF